jgi:hypothetical protein
VDKARIKMLLASFRPGTDDENDPLFREALEQLAHDPELAEWFRAEQEFDAAMVEKFREVSVDAAAGERIREALKRQIGTDAESRGT